MFRRLIRCIKSLGWKFHCFKLGLCKECGKGDMDIPFCFPHFQTEGVDQYGSCSCEDKMIEGETVSSGAELEKCDFCGTTPKLGVYKSFSGGYYVGCKCCQPHSRETGYFQNRKQAKMAYEELKEEDIEASESDHLRG